MKLVSREELIDLGGWAQKVADQLYPNQTVGKANIPKRQLRDIYRRTPGSRNNNLKSAQ
jgi:hypothetical protein